MIFVPCDLNPQGKKIEDACEPKVRFTHQNKSTVGESSPPGEQGTLNIN